MGKIKNSQYQIIKDGKKKCRRCNEWKSVDNFTSTKKRKFHESGFYSICRPCYRANNALAIRVRKQEIVDVYGGKCTCCNEDKLDFLTLDHVYGDGKEHRKEIRKEVHGGGHAIYRWLKKNNFPKGRFTILCMNCNWAKRYKGPCPHDVKMYTLWLKDMEKRKL